MTQLLRCVLKHPLPFSDWSTPQWASFVELKAAEKANLRRLSAYSPAVLAIASYLRVFSCPACFLFCCKSVLVFSISCFDFASYRYAETRKSVESMSMFRRGNMKEAYKPASSDDWDYCAFNEQLQRIAGQLATMIEGIMLVRLSARWLTLSCRRHPRRSVCDS